MISALFLVGIRYRKIVYTLVALFTLLTGAGLANLKIDTSFNTLIPSDEPERLVYQRVMDQFGSDNKTIVYVKDAALWSSEKLSHLDELVRALKLIPAVNRVDSVFNLRTIEGSRDQAGGEPVINTRPVLDGIPRNEMESEQARARAIGNPLYLGNLFSKDGSVTAIIITVEDKEDRENFSVEIYGELEAVLSKHEGHFERLFQVGPPRINAELRESLTDDFKLLGPLSALVLVASIMFFMRNSLAAAIPVLTSGLAIVWTFGVMGWTGVPLNILSAMIPSLIIVIGSTEDTHMISSFFRGLVENGSSRRERQQVAIDYMAKHTGLPMVLTIVTTALGFGSNLFGDILLIYHFAIASTLAIIFNGIVTILVVPPLLEQFGEPGKGENGDNQLGNTLPDQIIKTFRISQDKFPIYTLLFTFVLCSFFTYQASNLYVTNDPLSYFPDDRPLIQETKQIHEDLAGIKVFFVALESKKDKAFLEPENLRKVSQIQEFMAKQGVFDSTISIADHLKYVNAEFHGGLASSSLPPTKQLVSQYLLFFHRSELETYVTHDYRSANIVVRHNLGDSHTLNKYVSELKEAVTQISGQDIQAMVVGENLLVNHAAEKLMMSQVKALSLLLLLIFVIMSIMFTSFRGGAIAMIPSIIPIVLMFGIMGFLGIPLNPGTAMVAVIAVGIAVDGTIHLLARYNELCRRTSDYEGCVHQAVQEVATPLIVSSLALSLGFGILLFSNFTVVAQFGALAATTMLISIFANLLITPIIMARIRLVGLYQIIAMTVDQAVLEKSPLFADMTGYQRRKAILISEIHEFAEGEKLVEQGDVGRNMYMILEGSAQVVRNDDGQSRVLAELDAGDVFGEVGYIQEIERTADVIATAPVSALNFDYNRMAKDLKYFPHIVAKLNFNISSILGTRLADLLAQR
jgi:predicted RND superfamily exporter protein